MQFILSIQHWLARNPPGTNYFVSAVLAVAVVWILFERFGSGRS